MTFEMTALILSWGAILLMGLALSGIVRQVRYLTSIATPGAGPYAHLLGKPAPSVTRSTTEAKPQVLLFVNAECEVCEERLKELDQIAQSSPNVAFGALFAGPLNGFRSRHLKMHPEQDLLFEAMKIPITPFGIATRTDGVISFASPIGSADALKQLVARVGEAA